VSGRRYDSPLRERQAQQTRDAILDTLTSLLADRAVDEVTTREIANAAGVSERTVYRHFPDRSSLLEGLTDRFMTSGPAPAVPEALDDLGALVVELYATLEDHHIEAQAEALLNTDPRRYSEATRRHTRQFHELVEAGFPDLDDDRRRAVAAVVRVLASSQPWLRMRAEFGIDGRASGPVVAWAVDALLREVERGNPPPPAARSNA
jgi:AcrR family transcriptional regulator